MQLGGDRECTACGTRWSYYDTGGVRCPDCESPRSVSVGESAEHTAGTATFDLTSLRAALADEPVGALADRAADQARTYLRQAGFVDAGVLQPFTAQYAAAAELRRAGRTAGRLSSLETDEQRYLLALLRGADRGDRPSPADIPDSFHPERGLAVAASVETYLRELQRVVVPDDQLARALATITTRRKRIEALDGAVEPTAAEQLFETTQTLYAAVNGDNTPLEQTIGQLR
ncbi:MAG: hypothetical protein J07HX5_01406 [halophilic archaeon J07HX5]|jgi:hypothetical protein|nr:MAG: hypothetical protein J07HX5_01406 [halophilic archaeon J07HX5]